MMGEGVIEGGSTSSFRNNVTGGMDKSFSRFSKSMQSYDKKDVFMSLGVVFSAVLFGSAVGAASYRRKAKELAKKYPHRFEPPTAVKSGHVEEKFGEQNFRVLSEMRILGKIKVSILDFGRVSGFFSEIWREFWFWGLEVREIRVSGSNFRV